MNKSILILEENSMIHGLIASALDLDGLTLHHEFDPDEYVERARTLMPDLILLSNADQGRDYAVCRELRRDQAFQEVPLVLLASSRDRLEAERLRDLHVDGVIRKPFEASDLQQQVSKHLNLIDLIGSAYDYKKSQSLRDEGMGPLADMEVLDQEILGFLHDSAEAGPGAGQGVPQVDFSQELAEERAAPASSAAMVEETALEEALEPERAFEPVAAPEPAALAEPEPLAPDDVSLAGADFDESAAAESAEEPIAATFGEPMEELGAQDVLDEGAEEEARWAPEGFDQSFEDSEEGPAGEEQGEPLERVEMELAGADVDFDTAAEEMEEGEVELFETDFGQGAGPAPRAAEDEMIPEAVRRMVEMKPVLTMAQADQPPAEPKPEAVITPDDAELTAMAEELEQMDEFPVGQPDAEAPAEAPAAEAEAAEPATDWELAPPAEAAAAEVAAAGAGEEEFFHEDYLGDDEIDEDKIREAMQGDDEPDFEVMLDEDDEFAADALEDAELKEIEALETVDLDLSDEGESEEEEEILIEPDEEALVLASIEQDEALEEAGVEAAPAADVAPAELAELEEEEPRLEAFEEAAEEPPAGAEVDLLDRQLEALEESAGAMAGEPARTIEEPVPPIEEAAPMAEPEPMEEAPLEAMEAEPEPEAAWEFGESAEAGEESPFISEEAREMAAFAGSAEAAPGEEIPAIGEGREEHAAFEGPAELEGFDDVEGIAAFEGELESEEELEAFAGPHEEAPEPAGAVDLGSFDEAPAADFGGEEAEHAEMIGEAAAAGAAAAGDGGTDFDSVLAELQAEIEANPMGETLDDVLAKEGIVEAVEAVDFTIPQHEHPFTRAVGVLEIPGTEAVDEALLARVTAKAMPAVAAAALAGGGAAAARSAAAVAMEGLHEGIVDRLSEVLDEMIRDTVRRVVREEVPQLMERMRREESGHGR